MAVIIACILVLLFLTFLAIITGNDFITYSISQNNVYYQSLNGTTSEVSFPDVSATLGLDPLTMAVIWIIVIGVIAVGLSLTVLGSGLTESGARWSVGMIFYIAIWIMLSTFPMPFILDLENGVFTVFGTIIYLGLTIIYAIGVIMKLNSGTVF